MSNDNNVTGGCMCGAVRFEANGVSTDVGYCHCTDCRGFSGAPVVLWVVYETKDVRFTNGDRKTYESSPGIHWGFCGKCGTSLTWEANSMRYDGQPIIEFHISAFDEPELFTPVHHWMDFERIPWFDVADDLPRYAKMDVDAEPTHVGPRPTNR